MFTKQILKIALPCLIILCATPINSEARRVKGAIITNTLDTIPVVFVFHQIRLYSYQQRLKCFDQKNLKRILHPKDVYGVTYGDNEENTIRLSVNLRKSGILVPRLHNNAFLILLRNGNLKLFKYSNPITSWRYDIYVLQKNKEYLYTPLLHNFKPWMVSYLAECNEVVQKIKDGVYDGVDDLMWIVDDYNRSCVSAETNPQHLIHPTEKR